MVIEQNKGRGILNSIKKLIFEDYEDAHPVVESVPVLEQKEVVTTPVNINLNLQQNSLNDSDVKVMKLKVLEMLEKMNNQGVDFFEVWNAAAEMGNIDSTSIKAAFTSLRYVDKTLTKEKLISSGNFYAQQLKSVIDKESVQKNEEKKSLNQDLIKEKDSLTANIKTLVEDIDNLQAQLNEKQQALKEIDGKYEPQLKNIDQKIELGNVAVGQVIDDINKALNIIQTNLN